MHRDFFLLHYSSVDYSLDPDCNNIMMGTVFQNQRYEAAGFLSEFSIAREHRQKRTKNCFVSSERWKETLAFPHGKNFLSQSKYM